MSCTYRLCWKSGLLFTLMIFLELSGYRGLAQSDKPLHPNSTAELHQALIGTWYQVRYWGDANEQLFQLQPDGVMILGKPIRAGGANVPPVEWSWSTPSPNMMRWISPGSGPTDLTVTKISSTNLQLEEGPSGKRFHVDYARDTPDHLVRLVGRWKSRTGDGKSYVDYWIRYDGTVLVLLHSGGGVTQASLRKLIAEPGRITISNTESQEKPTQLGVIERDGDIRIISRSTGDDALVRCSGLSCDQ